jgi:hypothetical protein
MHDGGVSRVLASVVIRSYNYAQFLGEAIDSALAQTYAPLEVVVVDDGSTDDSRAVIAAYAGRIRPVLKQNGGPRSATNAGFAASSGEVVLFLDSDDVLLPTAVEVALGHLHDPTVAKVHWRMWEVDARRNRTGRLVPRKSLPEGALRDLVIANGPLVPGGSWTSGNVWRRSYLERVLPMPEHETQPSDAYLNTLVPLFGGIRSVPEPQSEYRVHGSNAYASLPASERSRLNLGLYHYRCRLLSQQLRAWGLDHQPDAWTAGHSRHTEKLSRHALFEELGTLIPAGATFILVDEGKEGDGVLIAGRSNVPFPQQTGESRRRPPDSDRAIQDVEWLRAAGASFLVFLRPALWWLRHYTELDRHLRSRYCCALTNERAVVFDLR